MACLRARSVSTRVPAAFAAEPTMAAVTHHSLPGATDASCSTDRPALFAVPLNLCMIFGRCDVSLSLNSDDCGSNWLTTRVPLMAPSQSGDSP